MTAEQATIKALFRKLARLPGEPFPVAGGTLRATDQQGVYVIRDPRKRVVHVGSTPRAARGIRQRLGDHLHNRSSFSIKYLRGKGCKLRKGYTFAYLPIQDRRHRALLEAYAIGCLCPAHIGLGQTALTEGS